MLYVILGISVLALVFVMVLAKSVVSYDAGSEKMQTIAGHIAKGAIAFLKSEYKVLSGFVLTVAILLALTANHESSSSYIGLAYILGSVFSGIAGYVGMTIATKANVRTTQAAKTSLAKALRVSFHGGLVMGISVVALGLLGLSGLMLLLTHIQGRDSMKIFTVITGFSLGAESVALFARVGGGIFTKAADVGADLVGKVEQNIPEDDPRNPAVIADNVGDNVGDIAGMGADLFGSFVSTILATMILGIGVNAVNGVEGIGYLFPLLVCTIGTVFSIIAIFFVRIKENGNPQKALDKGNYGAIVMTALSILAIVLVWFPKYIVIAGNLYPSINLVWAIVTGLGVGTIISMSTEYFCAKGKRPVRHIVKHSLSGAGTNVIAGLGMGMMSTAIPMVTLAFGIVISYYFGGVYGVALAATGMMATTGIQLAIDAFGPIADNAGGIAQMSDLPEEVRERTDVLDAVGNTTAAVGKGFAIASAALTSLALFSAYKEAVGITSIDISDAKILAGMFIGGMIPFLFSAFAIRAVGNAANAMVHEVRRQFKEIKGLLEGKPGVEADFARCVDISTQAAIKEMVIPGSIAIISPILVGFLGGGSVLGGFLVGVTVCGVLAAIFQSNAGGARDNAKKTIESLEDHKHHYKGSSSHKSSVVGDTVGDPLKDTSGPAINILIKLISIIALVIAPLIK